MSSTAPDAVKIDEQVKDDKTTPTAPTDDSQPKHEPETATPADAVTAPAAPNDSEPASTLKDASVSTKATEKEKPEAKENEKPKTAASTHSKTSSLTKSLSNGKIFGKKSNGDPVKRSAGKDKEASGAGSAVSDPSELKKEKKTKKRGKLWRILHSCFTPSHDGGAFDRESLKSSATSPATDSKKTKATATSAGTTTAGEKKNAALSVDTAAAALASAPHPPTPSRSGSAIAGASGEIVVPPTPRHELLPLEDTEGVTSGAVQPPGSTGAENESDASVTDDERNHHLEEEDDEERLILNGGNGIPIGPDGKEAPLLPPLKPEHKGRKCLVLDLDETLVHSSFKLIPQADYVVPVEIEWQWHNVYVIKRPGVDAFLKRMGEIYEIVVFTASLSKYADPVLDKLDVHKVVTHRLFRESCYLHKGNYVKDLSQLGRPIGDTIILDNSPASYIFHPNNAVPVSSWFNDPHDTELTDMAPFLADLAEVTDIRGVLDGGV